MRQKSDPTPVAVEKACPRHPPGDAEAIFSRREDPHRARRPSGESAITDAADPRVGGRLRLNERPSRVAAAVIDESVHDVPRPHFSASGQSDLATLLA